MTKLRDRIENLRQKPHAVRERFAVMGAIILAAIILGGWYGVRLGLNRREQAADSLASQGARPFSVVGNAWGDLMDYVNGVSDNLPELRNPFREAPTSTPIDVSIFQSSPSETTLVPTEQPPEDEQSPLENQRDLREASVQYGFDLGDVPEETQDE